MIESNTVFALSLGLVAAIGWGISGFFDAKSSRAVHPIVASLVVNGFLTFLYVVGFVLFWRHGLHMNATSTLCAAAGGFVIAVGALLYFTALRTGPVSLVSPMSSAYPLVTTIMALLLFGGFVTGLQGVAIALIVVGILAVTDFIPNLLRRQSMSRGPLLGLGTALCWGVGYALVAQSVRVSGWQQATLIELVAMMAGFCVCIALLKDRREVSIRSISSALRNRNVLIASSVALVAALSFNIGLGYDATGGAVVATLSAFYPILTVLLALRHFKESESVRAVQLLGAGMSIVGVIALAIL